jgi:hypothetical protein
MRFRFYALFVAAAAGACFFALGALGSPDSSQERGGRVDWARLVTPDPDWAVHSDRDPELADFLRRNTNLNIASEWASADPSSLEQLCAHPFIYAKDMMRVRSTVHLGNIREYLRRGGFICVDACATPRQTPDMQLYLRQNSEVFRRILPGAVIRRLPEDHPLFRCYFKVSESDVFTVDMGLQIDKSRSGIYGVYSGDRMVALISMDGLECGWPQTPMRTPGCMKLILNIYIYAMTAGPEALPAGP